MTGPVIHREFDQHSPEWLAIRSGKWTASEAAKVMGGLETKGLADLIKSVAWGRVHGPVGEDHFMSSAMARGHELEQEARDWYGFTHDCAPATVGFVEHATVPHVGWSPDSIDPATEIKCLLHKAYMEVLRTRKVPAEYRWQCRWAMWTGELKGLDFVAYHPAAGGIVIPCEVTESEKQQMEERVALLEPRVAEWVEIIQTRTEKAA